MSSNLPPGVHESDIPGNRQIDVLWERIHNWIDDTGLTPEDIVTAITSYTNRKRLNIKKFQWKSTEL